MEVSPGMSPAAAILAIDAGRIDSDVIKRLPREQAFLMLVTKNEQTNWAQ